MGGLLAENVCGEIQGFMHMFYSYDGEEACAQCAPHGRVRARHLGHVMDGGTYLRVMDVERREGR